MKYTIYKTTNTINGKYYIGAHATTGKNDWYKGSGTALKEAIRMHGGKNFITEVLEYCNSVEEMYNREAEIVNEDIVADRNSYNMKVGGEGWPKGKPKSEATKKKISNSIINSYSSDGTYLKSGKKIGRKAATDADVLILLRNDHTHKECAEILGLTVEQFKHRYHRAKSKLQNKQLGS